MGQLSILKNLVFCGVNLKLFDAAIDRENARKCIEAHCSCKLWAYSSTGSTANCHWLMLMQCTIYLMYWLVVLQLEHSQHPFQATSERADNAVRITNKGGPMEGNMQVSVQAGEGLHSTLRALCCCSLTLKELLFICLFGLSYNVMCVIKSI